MYDHPQPFSAVRDAAEHLQRGDAVLFRFPLAEEQGEPVALKRRACFMLGTLTKGDRRFVKIAYGTAGDTRANRGYEVIVKQSASRETAGLSSPIRFVSARRIIVHVGNSCFDGATKGSTIVGGLDTPLLERPNAVRARIQAEADIAAHYREERRWEEQARGERGFQQGTALSQLLLPTINTRN